MFPSVTRARARARDGGENQRPWPADKVEPPACAFARGRGPVCRSAKKMDAPIVRGPMEGPWAPGYYYVLFEDPDGIRLEVNFVPGAGLLAEGAQFNPGTGYV